MINRQLLAWPRLNPLVEMAPSKLQKRKIELVATSPDVRVICGPMRNWVNTIMEKVGDMIHSDDISARWSGGLDLLRWNQLRSDEELGE